jgi:hypothetical protein
LQPGEGASGCAAEGEFEVDSGAGGEGRARVVGAGLTGEGLGSEGSGLGADLEERKEEGVEDVAVENECLMVGLA